ncbi:MAG: lipid-transfer protein [Actinobacteria bacterium]|nr:lipid-transfer protein [Actinomycetota bacterium]
MPKSPLQDAAAIVGIAQSEFAKHLEPSEQELAAKVVVEALFDAGIDPSEVDAMCSLSMESTEEVAIASNIGAGDLTFFSQVGYGGGGGCATVGHCAMAVATGQATVAVAWRARKRGSGPRPWAKTSGELAIPGRWTRPFGLIRPVDEIAMLTRRYMHTYGATREHLANVAIAARFHANRNPKATMHDRTLTRDEYFSSRWISEPLCLFDNCLESDGAVAVVVVSADRAKDCRNKPAYVHSFAQGLPRQSQSMVNFFCDDPLKGPAWACARKLWANAEIGPQDVDVAQIYDAFTPLVLLSLEGYGFCPRGEAGGFTEDRNLEWGVGRLPINTSGGSLSEAYVHGFNLITEGVRQIRSTSTSQVEGAKTCLVTSGEGVPTSAILLRG